MINHQTSLSRTAIFWLILLALTVPFINTAWVAEDAFITFRAVDNLLAGNGAVWNLGERVQVYTHPLWYLLLSIGTAITHSSYYVALILSYLCLIGIAWIMSQFLVRYAANSYAIVYVAILLLSRAFMDYSSSGLENPLVHLLMGLYVWFWISNRPLPQRFFATTLIYGLVYLTRPDGIFLLTPASVYLLYQMFRTKQAWLKWSVLALLPVMVWEIFSIVYYGSPVPNTALAKVNLDYERSVLLMQAYHYFKFNLQNDPLTLISIISAIVLAMLNRQIVSKLIAAGLVLQLLYITHVGADYMMGRFLSPSLLMAVVVLILNQYPEQSLRPKVQAALIALLLLVSLPWQAPYTVMYHPDFNSDSIDDSGMADERSFYYQILGLIPVWRTHHGEYGSPVAVELSQKVRENQILFSCFIGQIGWKVQPNRYIVDPLALSEPFLARLPARHNARLGHYERAFPEGFMLSKVSNTNRIQQPVLHQLYDDVQQVTQGELWSPERWSAIWRLNTGYYRNLAQYFDRDAAGRDIYPPEKVDKSMHSCMGGDSHITADKI